MVPDAREPGPVRAAAIAAAAAELQMAVGVCGDRARGLAERIINQALNAAELAGTSGDQHARSAE